MKINKQLVLASQSPRRQEILTNLGLEFLVHPSTFTEKDTHLTAQELALHNALGKAQDVARHYKDALIIGVDTVVAFQDHQIGKPKDKEDAKRILRLLSSTTHEVISAICIIDTKNGKNVSQTQTTHITLERLEESDIEAYVNAENYTDKAAGFAIQGLGGLFVKHIEGDYFNVVGMPIYLLRKLLKEHGIKNFIKTLTKTN